MSYASRFLRAVGLGLPGIAVLVVLATPPEGLPRALLAVNPLVLLLLMALLGAWAAPRAGLRSVFVLGDPMNRTALTRVGLWATAVGVALALADHASRALWRPVGDQPLSLLESAGWEQVLLGLSYGGMTEEVLLRFGLMSGLLLGFGRILPHGTAAGLAIALSAGLFAAGHLPALLAAGIPLEPPLLGRVLLLNTGLGLWFGWLFYRHDLESAIKAHAGFHFGVFLTGLAF